MTATAPLVVNGWSLFAHPLFLDQLDALTRQVAALKERDPTGFAKKNATKRLAAIARLAFEIIPQDPTRPDYRQGGTLGDGHKHWFRAKFFQQYRLFSAITRRPGSSSTLGSTMRTPNAPMVAATMPTVDGLSVRADFDGGAMSSDFGPMILRGVDQQIGLTERLAQTIDDQRHPSYITHPLRNLLAQRIFQIACGDEDGNDANARRRDPLFKLGVERRPLDEAMDLASGPTCSRLENAVSTLESGADGACAGR